MNIDKIIENTIPVIVGSILPAIGVLIYKNRKDILILLKKLRIKLFPLQFNIAFALDFNEGFNSGNYFKEIKKNFSKLLDDTNLSDQIRIIDFSDIFLFNSRIEAEKFRTEKGIDLIIWGGFTGDKLKLKGENVNTINLNFTFGHEKMSKQIGYLIFLDLKSKMALKSYWAIFENDSLRDVIIVSNNLFDISTYILALILKIFGDLKKSTLLFENLYHELDRRNDDFKKQLIPHLIDCYNLLSLEYGLSGKDLHYAITNCNKILKIDPNNFSALCNLAVFLYKDGKKDEAEKTVDHLKSLYPNNPITILDVSFFRIIQKNYNRALKGYKKLLNFKRLNFNIQEVIEFLDDQYLITKEPALLFASGFLSCNFGDIRSGKNDLRSFLKKAKSPQYKNMVREAKKLLKKYV